MRVEGRKNSLSPAATAPLIGSLSLSLPVALVTLARVYVRMQHSYIVAAESARRSTISGRGCRYGFRARCAGAAAGAVFQGQEEKEVYEHVEMERERNRVVGG